MVFAEEAEDSLTVTRILLVSTFSFGITYLTGDASFTVNSCVTGVPSVIVIAFENVFDIFFIMFVSGVTNVNVLLFILVVNVVFFGSANSDIAFDTPVKVIVTFALAPLAERVI